MRILHVVTAFPRGPEDVIVPWLVELILQLRSAGHEVEVFTSAYRGAGGTEFRGIPVHRFRYAPNGWEDLTHDEAAPERMRRSLRYKVLPLFYLLGGLVGIWRLCRRRPYDVVHVHWPMPHALFGWMAGLACGAPMVTTWYGVELRWVQGSLPFLRPFLRWALRRSRQVVAISSYTAREIAKLAAVPVQVIPYTIGFPPDDGKARGPVPGGGFEILFVGRLVERKGVTHLIDAVRHLAPVLRPHLTIIGDGAERERLTAQVARDGLGERVTIRGRVSAAELRAAYAAARVLVLPSILDARSDTEGLGVVLLEAMVHGVPVIGSAIGGITDIVTDGSTGLLVPPGDATALAAALTRIGSDPELAARLGDAGRRHAREDFSWASITARWEACYAAAIRTRTDIATAGG